MTDELRRDAEIARALEGIAVPDYGAGFWDRLDARLSAEGFPGLDVPSLDVEHEGVRDPALPGLAPVAFTGSDQPPVEVPAPKPEAAPTVIPLPTAGRSVRRRSLVAVAAVAAAVVAVLALQLTEPAPETLETASGGPPVTGPAPRGGSTSPDGVVDPAAGSDDTTPDDGTVADTRTDPSAGGTGDDRGPAPGSTSAAFATGAPPTSVAVGPAGSKATAQDAFATWAAAIDQGDTDIVVALTGPRTARYYEGLGSTVAQASEEWGEAYGVWADPAGRRIDALEGGRSAGSRVVVLLLERATADGTTQDAVPVVQTADGWLVEPAALQPDGSGRIEMASPSPESRSGAASVRRSAVVEVVAAETGTYTLVLDRTTTATIAASEAVDGTIRWDPPDKAMTAGRHLLVVVHVSDEVVTTLTTVLEVAA